MLTLNSQLTPIERSTTIVATESDRLSAPVAAMAEDEIFLPTLQLYANIYSLTRIDASSIAAGSRPTSTGSGLSIFSTELISSSTPMMTISAATARPEIYSILPWPNGWSGSGFLPESRKPSSDIADAPASDRLLNASAVMAIEPEIAPAAYFPANSSALRNIPSRLHSVP